MELSYNFYIASVAAILASIIFYVASLVYRKETLRRLFLTFSLLTLLLLTVSLGLRWYITGHGPYMGLYEVAASYSWVLLAFYLALQWKLNWYRRTGLIVLLTTAVFLITGAAGSAALQFDSPSMRSIWLWTHMGASKLALASFVQSASIVEMYWHKKHASTSLYPAQADEGPDECALSEAQNWCVKLARLGFICLTVVMGSGILWANTAWGNYWNWNPVETWSLAAWMLYGLLLHIHYQWKIPQRRWAMINLSILAFSLFLYMVVQINASS